MPKVVSNQDILRFESAVPGHYIQTSLQIQFLEIRCSGNVEIPQHSSLISWRWSICMHSPQKFNFISRDAHITCRGISEMESVPASVTPVALSRVLLLVS